MDKQKCIVEGCPEDVVGTVTLFLPKGMDLTSVDGMAVLADEVKLPVPVCGFHRSTLSGRIVATELSIRHTP